MTTAPREEVSRHQQEVIVTAGVAIFGLLYRALQPLKPGVYVDHLVYTQVLDRMRRGDGYYDAMAGVYREIWGVHLGQVRSYREPTIFVFWRWIPESSLFLVFILMATVTAYFVAKLARRPLTGFLVGFFIVSSAYTTTTNWLLVEHWCAPFIAGCALAWRRERYWLAAAAASSLFLVRETAGIVLVAGLVLAIVQRKPVRPWLTCTAIAGAVFAAHWIAASSRLEPPGNEAPIAGTSEGLLSVVRTASWPFALEHGVATVLCLAYVIAIAYAVLVPRTITPAHAGLAIPFTGFFFDRQYWGLLGTFVALWLAGDAITEVIERRRGVDRVDELAVVGDDP